MNYSQVPLKLSLIYPDLTYHTAWTTVFQITASPSARSRQLWRRTGNFLKTFLQFYVYDLRFKAAGLTTFLIEFWTLWTMAESESDIRITTVTPYLTLTGELLGVFCDDFGENWVRYNSTALYLTKWSGYMISFIKFIEPHNHFYGHCILIVPVCENMLSVYYK